MNFVKILTDFTIAGFVQLAQKEVLAFVQNDDNKKLEKNLQKTIDFCFWWLYNRITQEGKQHNQKGEKDNGKV